LSTTAAGSAGSGNVARTQRAPSPWVAGHDQQLGPSGAAFIMPALLRLPTTAAS